MLFVRSLQHGQNYLLAHVNSSESRIFLIDLDTEEVKGKVNISSFSSWMLQQNVKIASHWCLESGWNDIECHLRYAFQLINHNL